MIRIFFGSPGCGKTTLACRNMYKLQKDKHIPYDYYFSNFDNDLSHNVSLQNLGQWTFPEHSYIVVDEAGIEYNSRKYKTLSQDTIAWLKLHRHYKCDVDFISQSWEDTDITIRRLADEYWYVKRLGPISLVRRVYKSVSVDDNTHQIIDAYKFGKLLKRILPFPFGQKTWFLVWRPKYYKYFNTHERPDLPVLYGDYAPYQRPARNTISVLAKKIKSLVVASVSGVARRVPTQRPASPIGEDLTSDSQKEYV